MPDDPVIEEHLSDFDLGPDVLSKPMRIRAVMARHGIAPPQGPIDFRDAEIQASVARFLGMLWNACIEAEPTPIQRKPGMRLN